MTSTTSTVGSIAKQARINRPTQTASITAAALLGLFPRDGISRYALALSASPPPVPRRPRTMAESMGPFGGAAPACPCCAFLTDDGLFLPPGIEPVDRGGNGEPADAARRGGDTPANEEEFQMPSPREALAALRESGRSVTLVDTHCHAHLDREGVDEYAADDGMEGGGSGSGSGGDSDGGAPAVVSLTCAVSQDDWERALEYASASDRTLPALGVHPWYLPSLSPDYLDSLEGLLLRHPRALVGEIGLCKVARFVREYPEEEGGKAAAMEWQRHVFREQFELAARLKRPATVHCVRQHGVFMAVMKEIREERRAEINEERKWRKRRRAKIDREGGGEDENAGDVAEVSTKSGEEVEGVEEPLGSLADAFPPAIGMHSFTGTAHHVKEILQFEQSLFEDPSSPPGGEWRGNKKKKERLPHQKDGRPPLFYFGFSHIVNVSMCSSAKSRRQGVEAVRAVPPDRLLAESDVHSPGNVAGGTAGSVAYLATATAAATGGRRGGNGDVAEMAEQTARNGLEFLNAGVERSVDGPQHPQ